MNDTLPTAFDWVSKGGVNAVKDQGQCGSCWSFATIANIEGVNFNENGGLISLSEQQLVDCDESDNGCDGGLPEQADKWLIATKNGLESEKDYPYEAVVGDADLIGFWALVDKTEPERRKIRPHLVFNSSRLY